jgi:hypothetical protein
MAHLKSLAYIIMVAALFCKPVEASQATQMTVGDLYKFCTSTNEADQNACRFYILGVFEGAKFSGSTVQDKAGNFQEAKEKQFCVPDGLTSSAMELTIKLSMGGDLVLFPQDRDLPAVSFITAVIAKRFPCQNAK